MDQTRETWLMDQVRTAARRHILPRFRALGAGEIHTKTGPDDLVTQADLEAEQALTAALHAAWPEALVIGEEAVSADPHLLDQIGAAETSVIIDPVDGTWNFANGLTTFGVIIAVARFGVPIWGGLYDPVLDDWVIGVDGGGTRFQTADASSGVTTKGANPGLNGFLPLFLFPQEDQARVAALLPSFNRVTSLRCSCHEYRLLAQGKIDFLVSVGLNPWDHLAGVLAVNEAGGVAKMLDGRPYDGMVRTGYLFAARDQRTWDQVAQTFDFLI